MRRSTTQSPWNRMMIERHVFKNLAQISGLTHGVFTRRGGVSQPPYNSLNVALTNGDSREAALENLRRVRDYLGVPRLASGHQVHGDIIQVLDEATPAGDGGDLFMPSSGDALVTRLRGVGLVIKIADCQAIFLVDPVEGVIANIHSGWRGSVVNLAGKTVRFLAERFGCKPQNLLAAVSPSLGPCHAEFIHYRTELPAAFWPYQTRPEYFDFWAITRQQLIEAGLPPEAIEIAGRCTVCESDHFFSYRRKRATGRMAAVIGWKD